MRSNTNSMVLVVALLRSFGFLSLQFNSFNQQHFAYSCLLKLQTRFLRRTRQTNMENCSHAPKLAVNLKHLPPIDPFRITNSSSNSKAKLNNSCSRAAAKAVKQNPNQGMKLVASDQDIVKNPSLGMENIVVQDTSSTSCNQKIESCGNTTSPTQTEEGMKKGIARSTLYEICAANRWKPPIFECCKEEGPSHKRMFTFKVIIEIEASRNTIECYGAPHRKKKAAADHAAEGALLYLKVYRMCYEKPIDKK